MLSNKSHLLDRVGARSIMLAASALAVCLFAAVLGAANANAAVFAPTFNQTLSSPIAGTETGLKIEITKNPRSSNIKKIAIAEAEQIFPNYPAYGTQQDLCPASSMPSATATFDPTSCPAAAKVGTIAIKSPAFSGTATGTAYLIDRSPVPWIGFDVSPTSAPGNPATVTVRFALMGSVAQADPLCDPNVMGCQLQLIYTTSTLTNRKISSVTIDLDGPARQGQYGPLSGKIFRTVRPPCTPTLVTKAAFTPFIGLGTTVTDTDVISGC